MENSFFWTEQWCVDGDRAWLVSAQYNFLCEVNMKSRTVNVIENMPYICKEERQYSFVTETNGKVFLLPDRASKGLIYDTCRNEWRYLSVDCCNGRNRCTDGFWIKDELWVFSAYKKSFFIVDEKKESIVRKIVITDDNDMVLWDQRVVLYDDTILVPCRNVAAVFRINTVYENVTYIKYNVDAKFRTIVQCGDEIVVSDERGNIHILDAYDLKYKEIIKSDLKNINGDYPYVSSYCIGNRVWMIPYSANIILCFNKETRKIKRMKMDDDAKTNKPAYLALNYVREKRYLGISAMKGNTIYEIDTVDGKINPHEYRVLENKNIAKIMSSSYKGIIYEDCFWDLKKFASIFA